MKRFLGIIMRILLNFSGIALFAMAGLFFSPETVLAAGQAEHVVVVVWDGMRPDFVSPQYAPTLYSLATNGVFFKKHHSTYVSTTEVNGTALATGMHPSHSGVMANAEYRPEIAWLSPSQIGNLDSVRRGDLLSSGKYLLTPTLAEMLQGAGIRTVVAGTKPVALLQDRSVQKLSPAAKESVTLFKGVTIPRSAGEALLRANHDKPFPADGVADMDAWTTKALTRGLWKDGVPKFSMLWLGEPDASQHGSGVASTNALAGIESSDRNLAEVINALEEKRVLAQTDIFVVSDHGFSTVRRGLDVLEILKKAKFKVSKFESPEPGDLMVVHLGGSISFYVIDHVESEIRRLVEFLQTSDFAGVIFSRFPVSGTFALDQIRIGTTNSAPDVVVSLRWSADQNECGVPGLLGTRGPTVFEKSFGMHGSLSRFDMHNTLVATGPDLKKAFLSEAPSGNIDLAPTILWLLNVKPSCPLDGRVLHEALANSTEEIPKPIERKIEASREVGFYRWQQYLKITEIGGALYFDEGNGEPALR